MGNTMKDKEKPAAKRTNSKPKEFDREYIRAYLDAPENGKLAALRKTSHPNPTRTRAWDLHNRLKATINSELDAMIIDGAAVGYNTTLKLAKGADSESVQAKCAENLMAWGDKTKPAKIEVLHTDSAETMDAEIAILTERIAKATNTTETKH